MSKQEKNSQNQQSAKGSESRPKWWRLYFVLAAFDLITICFGLYLNHRLVVIHEESVAVNQKWAERIGALSELAQLGGDVNAPGNDVFDSHDVPRESARMNVALTRFTAKLNVIKDELLRDTPFAFATQIADDLKSLRLSMKEMTDEANLIFSFFGNKQADKAGKRMATMDRKFAQLNQGFATLGKHIREIQAKHFKEQQLETVALRRYEYTIVAAILLIVTAVTFYGHRMGKTFHLLTQEKEQYIAALQAAQSELEDRVRERTSDLEHANEELSNEIIHRAESQRRLEEMQNQLVKASRHAGMQEVATGVLHNVGNVLNSVNVSASLLRESLNKSQIHNLTKATQLLRDNSADTVSFLTSDPKGQLLPGYLIRVGDHIAQEQEAWRGELDQLGKNIEHIKQIVSMQQSYARLSGLTEDINAEELVEDAIRMNEGALDRHGIRLIREFQKADMVTVDRHKALQILVNLVRNAKHALDESDQEDKTLTISIKQYDNESRVMISVTDNGVGISQENLSRIFQHGFTTKKDGHGFGLHSGVNTAREMNGNLSVTSDGPGNGATFTLELQASTKPELTTP